MHRGGPIIAAATALFILIGAGAAAQRPPAVKPPKTYPLTIDLSGRVTMEQWWIDRDTCAQGYDARLTTEVDFELGRPVRITATDQRILGNWILFTPVSRARGKITVRARTGPWGPVPATAPDTCRSPLPPPIAVPPTPTCANVDGRIAVQLAQLTVKKEEDEDDLAPLAGSQIVALKIFRWDGKDREPCQDAPPGYLTSTAGADDESPGISVPWADEGLISFPAAFRRGPITKLRRGRSLPKTLTMDGPCEKVNSSGRKADPPRATGDHDGCSVTGKVVVTVKRVKK